MLLRDSSAYIRMPCLQDIQAKHKLDSYDKIKDKAIFDMVHICCMHTPCSCLFTPIGYVEVADAGCLRVHVTQLDHACLPTLQYKQQLDSLRSKVVEDMETVKRRDNLDFVQVQSAGPC